MGLTIFCSIALAVVVPTSALAEFQCAPAGASVQLPEGDVFFQTAVVAWTAVTNARELEGKPGSCVDFAVPGYEGFPTKRCSYSAVDDGASAFQPLAAQVVLLNPSARQLASWSVSACRSNGATDVTMAKCLAALQKHVVDQNGAQFPVVGSVIESTCNSSGTYPDGCGGLKPNDSARQPRNTWFRDGVSVDYRTAQGIMWDIKTYSNSTFDAVFNVGQSDQNLQTTYSKARIAAAVRDQWIDWRAAQGKPLLPDGSSGTIQGPGWRVVSAAVHKAACRAASNELFDAVVYANRQAWIKP